MVLPVVHLGWGQAAHVLLSVLLQNSWLQKRSVQQVLTPSSLQQTWLQQQLLIQHCLRHLQRLLLSLQPLQAALLTRTKEFLLQAALM